MPLVLAGATSGSTTIQATDATTQTITLPNNTGTIITTGSSGQSIPKAALPTGSVLQVIQSTSSTVVTNATLSSVSLLTASITPISTGSKILILISVTTSATATSNALSSCYLYRGTIAGNVILQYSSGGNLAAPSEYSSQSLIWLDSPSTTSSQLYTLGLSKGSGSTSTVSTDGPYSLTLMEIAA
jgi:hypothetical protein